MRLSLKYCLLVCFLVVGCATAAPRRHRASAAALRASTSQLPHFTLRTPYVSTLMAALEALSGASAFSGASRWAPWFAPWHKERPAWLKAFAQANWKIKPSPYYRHLIGGGRHYQICSYYDISVDALITCLKAMAPPGAHHSIEQAVRKMDERLKPHWDSYFAEFQRFRTDLTTLINSPQSGDLIGMLRHFWDLDVDIPLSFEVVLVLTPPDTKNLLAGGQHNSGYLVIAVNPKADMALHLDVLFHELCHLAGHHSRYAGAFEGGLNEETEGAAIAGRYWNEAIASAFGSGIAAERFFGPFDASKKRFYFHYLIDPLGREFYRYWRHHPQLRFGVESGRAMSVAAQKIYPYSKWKLADHIIRLILIAEDAKIRRIMWQRLHGTIFYNVQRYIVTQDRLFLFQEKTIPQVFVFHKKALLAKPRLLGEAETSVQEVSSVLSHHDAAYYWKTTHEGRRILMLSANSVPALHRSTARLFAQARTLKPQPGWHPIP
ncbi:MAG: hypothetical protein H6714_10605 [Myxococcales bacterium]|nr:hypothetical protein [Myxococcales bacterium]